MEHELMDGLEGLRLTMKYEMVRKNGMKILFLDEGLNIYSRFVKSFNDIALLKQEIPEKFNCKVFIDIRSMWGNADKIFVTITSRGKIKKLIDTIVKKVNCLDHELEVPTLELLSDLTSNRLDYFKGIRR